MRFDTKFRQRSSGIDFRRRSCALSLTLVTALALVLSACARNGPRPKYFGKTDPPRGEVLRYITGPEPESLDPQIGTGQPEARIYMALYEGLVEYHPKTMEPIPAIAESWDVSSDFSVYTFRLRRNARFSNGDPINAQDFVYSLRRAVSPALASRNASFGYYIRYAEAFNDGGAFVRDPQTGRFLTTNDVKVSEDGAPNATPSQEPLRLVVAGDEKDREKEFKANPRLRAAVEGKELLPVSAEDIGLRPTFLPGETVDQERCYKAAEEWLRHVPRDWWSRLVLHQHHELVATLGLGGRHWRDDASAPLIPPAGTGLTSRSCHDLAALRYPNA